MDAVAMATALGLEKHFEGGYFKEHWRSKPIEGLEVQMDGEPRVVSTSIYYMMNRGKHLCWHRLRGDNIHTWHHGGILKIFILDPFENGSCTTKLLGNPLENRNCNFHVAVPGGHWYAAQVIGSSDYTLWGEIVTPGWELEDYEEATLEQLVELYPEKKQLIKQFVFSEQHHSTRATKSGHMKGPEIEH